MADIKLYTTDEVCEILSVSRRTLYTYIKDGNLKAVKMGRYLRITEESLRAFIENASRVQEERQQRRREK